jgi:hypothetical protein
MIGGVVWFGAIGVGGAATAHHRFCVHRDVNYVTGSGVQFCLSGLTLMDCCLGV